MKKEKRIILLTMFVIIGVLYFLLFNNIYLLEINILYTNIIIIVAIKKNSGIKYKISCKKIVFNMLCISV